MIKVQHDPTTYKVNMKDLIDYDADNDLIDLISINNLDNTPYQNFLHHNDIEPIDILIDFVRLNILEPHTITTRGDITIYRYETFYVERRCKENSITRMIYSDQDVYTGSIVIHFDQQQRIIQRIVTDPTDTLITDNHYHAADPLPYRVSGADFDVTILRDRKKRVTHIQNGDMEILYRYEDSGDALTITQTTREGPNQHMVSGTIQRAYSPTSDSSSRIILYLLLLILLYFIYIYFL